MKLGIPWACVTILPVSSCYNVDSIRSPDFVKRNGFGASVMDYMRYNYVVQPEDKMPAALLLPGIGIYDRFAIEWGYRYLPVFQLTQAGSRFTQQMGIINEKGSPAYFWKRN